MIYEIQLLLNLRLQLSSSSRAGSVVYVVSTYVYLVPTDRCFIHSNSVSAPLIALNFSSLVYFQSCSFHA